MCGLLCGRGEKHYLLGYGCYWGALFLGCGKAVLTHLHHSMCMCVGVCIAPGCCMFPAYVCVGNVGVCIAGSSMGKGVTEEEWRKRVCACTWCLCICCVEVCVKELRNVHKGEGGWCGLLTQNPCCWDGDVVKYTWR